MSISNLMRKTLIISLALCSWEVLASKPDSDHDAKVQLSLYQDFYLAPIELEFDAYWLKKFRGELSKRDLDRIQRDYPALLQQQLVSMLSERHSLAQTLQPHPGTLMIQAKLSSFKLTAPDLSFTPKSDSYVDYTGAAQVAIGLYNFAGKSPITEFTEYRNTPEFGGLGDFKKTDRARNKHDFKLLCSRWARKLEELIAGTP